MLKWLKQDTIPIPVPDVKKPGLPSDEEAVGFGQRIADFMVAHPRPIAALLVTAFVLSAWKIPKVRGVMLFAAGIIAALWLASEGVIGG